jgi:molybdate transport system substrate-binding protein
VIRIWRFKGGTNLASLGFLASLLLLVVLLVLLLKTQPASSNPGSSGKTDSREALILYCAAGIKPPVEAAAKDYEKEYGVQVQLQYGGSQTLLANMQVSQSGDLYLPADESYIAKAREKTLVEEVIPLAEMTPQLVVLKGNPKGIKSINDLLQKDVRIAQANPDAAAIGKLTRELLTKSGQWEKLKARTTTFKVTVNEVANDVKINAIDAGFVWDATVHQYPEIEAVPAPELAGAVSKVSVCVTKYSKQPQAALRFARYLGSRNKGLKHFEKHGYKPVDADEWSEKPEIRLFAGAMLRPAIQETLQKFEEREGCSVLCVYNGCGILVAQMRAGQTPDAYFACDKEFMKQVKDLFLEASDISQNQLVIVVPKGNPHGIKALKDLGAPGLRVGVGHEKQCAMGVLTKQTLEEGGSYKYVMKNVTVQSPTGDFLVNQLRTGSLDAVIAYASNIAHNQDTLEAIAINIPCALAIQPFAVGRDSTNKQMTERLLDAIKRTEKKFEEEGFVWKSADHK